MANSADPSWSATYHFHYVVNPWCMTPGVLASEILQKVIGTGGLAEP
jgi:hypothetical protein